MDREVMPADPIDKPATVFAAAGLVLVVQACQCWRRKRNLATTTFFLDTSDHWFLVLGLELVISGDQVRRRFAPQSPGLFREDELGAFGPARSRKSPRPGPTQSVWRWSSA